MTDIHNQDTHHMVDDLSPQEQALDQFETLFPYSRYVRKEGCITYSILHPQVAKSMEKEAAAIISSNSLPLTVSRQNNTIHSLTIKHKQ